MTCATDHLRLRGENLVMCSCGRGYAGPPPPARRERSGSCGQVARWRTTSACAERTMTSRTSRSTTPDHLRLRGENPTSVLVPPPRCGPPPPARREHHHPAPARRRVRTTSACAERTSSSPWRRVRRSDHLRL